MKSKKPTIENISRAVMIFVKRAKSESERKRAYKYASAITPFLEKNTSPAAMHKALEGGIEQLIRRAAKAKKGRQTDAANNDAADDAVDRTLTIVVPLELYKKAVESRAGQRIKLWARHKTTKNKSAVFEADKIVRLPD